MSDDESRATGPDEIDWEAWWSTGPMPIHAERPTRSAASPTFAPARALALVRAFLLGDKDAVFALVDDLPRGEAAVAMDFARAVADFMYVADSDYVTFREAQAEFLAKMMSKHSVRWSE
ncbi:hypothetical protein OG423_32135 [Micromonospora zamorensis]|uniref:hypothetical protein n=1 Tax=Micromonospora zamorensis TaxID=709883 RepID=UPI00352A75A0|nr:hypothetical protein OG423_32135 [Micromonospora zamorensis]